MNPQDTSAPDIEHMSGDELDLLDEDALDLDQLQRVAARWTQLANEPEDRTETWHADPAARKAQKRLERIDPELAEEYERVEAEDEWNYDAINTRARYVEARDGRGKPGASVKDYIALSGGNDPYYVGAPADVRAAEWIRDLWPRLKLTKALHIRAIHYAIRGLGNVVTWFREKAESYIPYDGAHSDTVWRMIMEAIAAGRYLGTVPWHMVIDKKNPEPYDALVEHVKPEAEVAVVKASDDLAKKQDDAPIDLLDEDDSPTLPELPEPPEKPELEDIGEELPDWIVDLPTAPDNDELAEYEIKRYKAAERHYLEVWCEKSGPTDTLKSWCYRHNAALVTGEGFMTLTAAYQIVKRVVEDGRPGVVMYVSDLDFAGDSMPIALSRAVQWQRDRWHVQHPDDYVPEIIVVRAALTIEQVRQYGLMDEPIKESLKFVIDKHGNRQETARWTHWQALYGPDQGTVELDALEGTQPGLLSRVLDEAVAPFEDRNLHKKEDQARHELENALKDQRDEILDEHAEDLDAAREGWETASEEAETLVKDAYTEATEPIREPWEQARQVLDEAWEEAWKILEPAWKKAHELTDQPLADARQKLVEAQDKANEQLREAWQKVVEVAEAVETDLTERTPDVTWKYPGVPEDEGPEEDEDAEEEKPNYAPPWGAEAPDDVLDEALFWSKRTYMEQIAKYKEIQGKEGIDATLS